jgi:hypothetical protein
VALLVLIAGGLFNQIYDGLGIIGYGKQLHIFPAYTTRLEDRPL